MKFRAEFPLPDVDWPPTREFWAGAARRELVLPRCDACARYVWYPDGACRHCGATAQTWTRVSGRGRLFSWSVIHRPFIPQLADLVPFVTALVAIDEDPAVRLATLLVDTPPRTLRVDMPVTVVFQELRFAAVKGTVVAPMFTAIGGAAG
jgi:uncharacterized OB-fold protein